MDSNYLNSSYPLWRSFDVFEGPIEYFSENDNNPTTDFENLIYFNTDSLVLNSNTASVCVSLANKTASTVTANLVVKGPEHFDYNSEVPENSTDLEISAPILTWGTETGSKCINIQKSNSYDDSAYDKLDAYYYLEIVPEGEGTIYRGDKLLIKVSDTVQ